MNEARSSARLSIRSSSRPSSTRTPSPALSIFTRCSFRSPPEYAPQAAADAVQHRVHGPLRALPGRAAVHRTEPAGHVVALLEVLDVARAALHRAREGDAAQLHLVDPGRLLELLGRAHAGGRAHEGDPYGQGHARAV